MPMVVSCLTFVFPSVTPKSHRWSIFKQPEAVEFGLIRTYTSIKVFVSALNKVCYIFLHCLFPAMVKFVCHYWVHGVVIKVKVGIVNRRRCFRCNIFLSYYNCCFNVFSIISGFNQYSILNYGRTTVF